MNTTTRFWWWTQSVKMFVWNGGSFLILLGSASLRSGEFAGECVVREGSSSGTQLWVVGVFVLECVWSPGFREESNLGSNSTIRYCFRPINISRDSLAVVGYCNRHNYHVISLALYLLIASRRIIYEVLQRCYSVASIEMSSDVVIKYLVHTFVLLIVYLRT